MYDYKYRKELFFEGWVVFECFESQSTRELGKLSEGSSVTTKDLIVTPSQLDRLWPIYRKPTLLSNGSSALLASSPLTSPPFFSPPYPSWFSHDSLTAVCSIAVFLASITLVFLVTYFWSTLSYCWPMCVIVKISRSYFLSQRAYVKPCNLLKCEAGQMWLLHHYCLWLHL